MKSSTRTTRTVEDPSGAGVRAQRASVRKALKRTRDGAVRVLACNLDAILGGDPELAGIALNSFAGHIVVAEPTAALLQLEPGRWPKIGVHRIRSWISKEYDVEFSYDAVRFAVESVATSRAHSPVANYLESLTWDGVPRLERMLHVYCGAEDNDYTRAVSVKFMLMCADRALHPGCRAEAVLVLEGPQGIGKSSFVRTLASDEYFSDHFVSPGGRDAALLLSGVWLVEIAELAQWRRSGDEEQKAFLTQRFDRYRRPYDHYEVVQPRSCAFVITTNATQYLTDSTGNRRYLPVGVTRRVRLAELVRDRDGLWAEAVHRLKSGESTFIEEDSAVWRFAERVQRARLVEDGWDEAVGVYLEARGREGVTPTSVLREALGYKDGDVGREHLTRMRAVLASLGWRIERRREGEGKRTRRYFPGPDAVVRVQPPHEPGGGASSLAARDVKPSIESATHIESATTIAEATAPLDVAPIVELDTTELARRKWTLCRSASLFHQAGFVWAATVSRIEHTHASAPVGQEAREAMTSLLFYASPATADVPAILAALEATLLEYAAKTPRDQYHPFTPKAVNGWNSRGRCDEVALAEAARVERMSTGERREYERANWVNPNPDPRDAQILEDIRAFKAQGGFNS
jgi:predicted P-loop ATPase